MTNGHVTGLQALVNVLFLFANQPAIALEFVVDTGFEGALTLPLAAIKALNLPFFQQLDANLANDATVRVDVYVARILWEGAERDVLVLATGRRPLLGTALLNRKRLCVDFEDNGPVTINDLP